MEKVEFAKKVESRIFIHNDLSNAAFHQFKLAQELVNGEGEGLSLVIMAGLTFYAFTIEAKCNFIGMILFDEDWKEKDDFKKKFKKISKALGIKCDFGERPFSTVKDVNIFRNTLAHGKPETLIEQEIVKIHRKEIDRPEMIKAEWEKQLTLEFLTQVKSDIEEIWRRLLEGSGMNIMDTLSGGSTDYSIFVGGK